MLYIECVPDTSIPDYLLIMCSLQEYIFTVAPVESFYRIHFVVTLVVGVFKTEPQRSSSNVLGRTSYADLPLLKQAYTFSTPKPGKQLMFDVRRSLVDDFVYVA